MWEAGIYNRYGKERMQPSIDLAGSMREKEFQRILDVGCGTGMSTASLVSNWRKAEIIGVDRSEEMLQKARELLPEVQFLQRDCQKPLSDLGKFDLIFSNAFLQWLPEQEEFIANSFAMLHPHGIFAAQIPLFKTMPAYGCIVRAEMNFADQLQGIEKEQYVLHSATEYYDMLAKHTDQIEMWITDYCHQMDSVNNILEFLRGTALHPYLDRLNGEEQEVFLKEVLKNLEQEYSSQPNGKVLFPFKRLFLVGQK